MHPTGIGYVLKYQARCISDVKADTDHTFLTGILSFKEENEIWDLSPCPLISTVFSTGELFEAAIWQIPGLYGQQNSPQLESPLSMDTVPRLNGKASVERKEELGSLSNDELDWADPEDEEDFI